MYCELRQKGKKRCTELLPFVSPSPVGMPEKETNVGESATVPAPSRAQPYESIVINNNNRDKDCMSSNSSSNVGRKSNSAPPPSSITAAESSRQEYNQYMMTTKPKQMSQLEILQAIVADQEIAIKRLTESDMNKAVELEHMRSSIISLRQDLLLRTFSTSSEAPVLTDEHLKPSMRDYQRLRTEVKHLRRNASVKYLNEYGVHATKKRRGLNVEPIANQDPEELQRLESQLEHVRSQMEVSAAALTYHSTETPRGPYSYDEDDVHQYPISPGTKRMGSSKLSKRPWTQEEDKTLVMAVQASGPKQDWSDIARVLPGRCGKQCRERWVNHLSPSVCKDAWTEEEDDIIFSTRDVRS